MALLFFGKEKPHLFHSDGEGAVVGVGMVAKALDSGRGDRVMFSSRRPTFFLSGLEETHAGDTEETEEASVLEVLENSELSSTFFPKSCKRQFRNWQDRKCYSPEGEGPRCWAKRMLGAF